MSPIHLRPVVAPVAGLLIVLLIMSWFFVLEPRDLDKGVLCFQLQSKWGEPSSVSLYSLNGRGGFIVAPGMKAVFLNENDLRAFSAKLHSIEFQNLSPDTLANLHCDARFGPSDEDIFVMHDWAKGRVHTVECFSGEPGVGQELAEWLLQKAGLQHRYFCA